MSLSLTPELDTCKFKISGFLIDPLPVICSTCGLGISLK